VAWTANPQGKTAVMVGSLDGPGDKDGDRLLMPGESNADYASGHLLFIREGKLVARPFDPRRLRFTGEPFSIADGVRTMSSASLGVFSAAEDNLLVYLAGGLEEVLELVWVNAEGEPIGRLGDRARYGQVQISPDDAHVAVEITDPRTETSDLWIYDVASGIRSRFTFDAADDAGAEWSPDGQTIIFCSNRRGHYDLYRKALRGTQPEELLFASDQDKYPEDWSPDGRLVLFSCEEDIWVLPLLGERQPYPFLHSEDGESMAGFSPDGRWVVYQCDEPGGSQVYVTAFPDPARKWQVSKGFGMRPRWSRASGNITYITRDAMLTSVASRAEASSFEVGASRQLFNVWGAEAGCMRSDAQSGILVMPAVENEVRELTLVLNWQALAPER